MAINAPQGPTGITGPTGPTGPAGTAVIMTFDAVMAAGYVKGQIIHYNGQDYIVNIDAPVGTPGTSPDYTLLTNAGPTGATGAAGKAVVGTFTVADAANYVPNQIIQLNGIDYIVNVANPAGIPGSSPDYTPLAEYGPTGAEGAAGSTGAEGSTTVVPFEAAPAVPYTVGQLVQYAGADYIVNVENPTGTPDASADFTLLTSIGPTGADNPGGATGAQGYPGLGGVLSFDSGSFGGVLLLESALEGTVATNVVIGEKMWGAEVAVLGAALHLDPAGLPPWPMKVTRGGVVSEWSASFEMLASVSDGTTQELHAQLLYAEALGGTPQSMADLEFQVIDDMNLGVIPAAAAVFQAFSAYQFLPAPGFSVGEGDYLLVRFYIDSNLVGSVNGFHAQAAVAIS